MAMTDVTTGDLYQTHMIRPEALDFAKKWIADLRSGKFEQGTGKLERVTQEGSEFCCLGVACKRIFDERLIPNFTHVLSDVSMSEAYGTFQPMHNNVFYRTQDDRSEALLPLSASMFIFGGNDFVDPRIFLTEEEYEEFKHTELGQTFVPDGRYPDTDIPLHQHGYFRQGWEGHHDACYEFSLMSLNDSGVPFTVIADMIEKFMLPQGTDNA